MEDIPHGYRHGGASQPLAEGCGVIGLRRKGPRLKMVLECGRGPRRIGEKVANVERTGTWGMGKREKEQEGGD